MFRETKEELLCFVRTGEYVFAKEILVVQKIEQTGENVWISRPNPIIEELERLMQREKAVRIKVLLMSDEAFDKRKSDPDRNISDQKKFRDKTIDTITELNEKYPNRKIEIKFSDEPLFVAGCVIDHNKENAKVNYTPGYQRHKNPIVYTFVKNKGNGIGYHATADRMIEFYNSPSAYHLRAKENEQAQNGLRR